MANSLVILSILLSLFKLIISNKDVEYCEYSLRDSKTYLNCASEPEHYVNCFDSWHSNNEIAFRNCEFSELSPEFFNLIKDPLDVWTMDISNVVLKQLNGEILEKFPRLNHLLANDNQLTEANLSGTQIEHLNLAFNYFTDIKQIVVGSRTKLLTLILSNNNITDIADNAFWHLQGLIKLDLSYNNLNAVNVVAFDELRELFYLNLAYTNLSYIDFGLLSALKSLENINISGNHIKTIQIGSNSAIFFSLTSLDVSSNSLMELNGFQPSEFPKLESLDLRYNKFNCSHLKAVLDAFNLHELNLPSDRISAIEPEIQIYRGLACKPTPNDREMEIKTNKIGNVLNEELDKRCAFHQIQTKLSEHNSLIVLFMAMFILTVFATICYINRKRIFGSSMVPEQRIDFGEQIVSKSNETV